MPRTKTLRIVAGVAAGAVSLTLTILLTVSPETFGLSTSPALFEQAQAQDRGKEAFLFLWALIAIPVSGLLHTPLAGLRGARIGAGWALLAGYWLLVLLLALLARQMQGLFPATDGPGKSGGIFGAAVALVIGTPVGAVCSGAVFRTVRPGEGGTLAEPGDGGTLAEQIRNHLAAVAVLTGFLTGAVVGLVCGLNFSFPRAGAPALLLPGGVLWGLHAGAALGTLMAARLETPPERRHLMANASASYARTAATLLACCLCVSQLGWVLPGWAVALVGVAAPVALFALADRNERLGRWVDFRQVELPKGAWS